MGHCCSFRSMLLVYNTPTLLLWSLVSCLPINMFAAKPIVLWEPLVGLSFAEVPAGYLLWLSVALTNRLRPIPEFTDTTDTDTLDLHQCRYRVPIPIPVVTLQPPRRVVSRYIAWALSRPVMKVLNISISTPITIFWKPFTITIVMSMPILLT